LVGDEIGVLKTLLLCVLTAIIGGLLVRHQGFETLRKAQTSLAQGQMPLDTIFDGICIVISGALLLTPGFFTDIIGFSLLVPVFRSFLRQTIVKSGKFSVHTAQNSHNRSRADSDIIEGDYEEVPKEPKNLK
jgi:UPF0716 protein FxsA